MSEERLKRLADAVTDAHTRIQAEFADINPVVGINRQMRTQGIAVDLMTIDCLRTQKRIIVVLEDQTPERIRYQFAWRDRDPSDQFAELPASALDADLLFQWIRDYFRVSEG